MTRRLLAICCLALLLPACAPWARIAPDDHGFEKRDDYRLDLPIGWAAGGGRPPTSTIFS